MLAVLAATPTVALAQSEGSQPEGALTQGSSLGSWSLPAPKPTKPVLQGPVDAKDPVVQTTKPLAVPSPAPTIAAPPPPPPAPVASATPTAKATPQPTARATPAAKPSASPSAPAPEAGPAPTEAVQAASPPPTRAPQPAPAPAPSGQDSAWPAWLWAIPIALALLVLGFVLRRRRPALAHLEPAEEPLATEPVAQPAARPAALPRDSAPVPLPKPAFTSPTPANAMRAQCDIVFEPVAMRLSLVYATLQFRLVLTAKTECPSGKVLADMISAHSSLPQTMQLQPPPEALSIIQATPRLAAGQSATVAGTVQLPLNAFRPVEQNGATFMVPLVRLALLGDDTPDLPHLELGRVFTVGLPGTGPAVAPLRLDTGPRELPPLSAREIESARRTVLLGLDPARIAG